MHRILAGHVTFVKVQKLHWSLFKEYSAGFDSKFKNMTQEKVKLFFNLPPDNRSRSATESMWCEPTPQKSLILMNSPFYAKGVSFLDEVSFLIQENNLVFKEILKKSGHSTYRILQLKKEQIEKFNEYWKPIEALGCTFESKIDNEVLYSVDVPPETDIQNVYKLLEKGEADSVWYFEEGDYGRKKE